MRRFRFSLEALLEVRKRAQHGVERELAQKNREIFAAQSNLMGYRSQLADMQAGQKSNRAATTDIFSLRNSVSFRHWLKLAMLRKGRLIQEFQRHAQEIRGRLVEATRQKRAIELIREKHYREWLGEYRNSERAFMDDVSQQGFIRKRGRRVSPSVA